MRNRRDKVDFETAKISDKTINGKTSDEQIRIIKECADLR